MHRAVAFDFLPPMARVFHDHDVEMRCDELSRRIVEQGGMSAVDATPQDWDTEYNAPIISIRIVESLDEAIDFINLHSSHHTDAIITKNFRQRPPLPARGGLELRDGQRLDSLCRRLRIRPRR